MFLQGQKIHRQEAVYLEELGSTMNADELKGLGQDVSKLIWASIKL